MYKIFLIRKYILKNIEKNKKFYIIEEDALMKGERVVKEIQLENFRSLKNTNSQKLSSITLLVGENSSGKSSFLRVFPLLKQSINKRTSGPILWSGDVDDYVDFGSFEETVTNDTSNNISFKFKFVMNSFRRNRFYINTSDKLNLNIEYRITVKTKTGDDYVSNFSLSINNINIDFDLENNSISVGQEFVYQEPKRYMQDEGVLSHQFRTPLFFKARSKAFGFSVPDISELWEDFYKQEEYPKSKKTTQIGHIDIREIIDLVGLHLFQNGKISKLFLEEQMEKIEQYPEGYVFAYKQIINKLKRNKELQKKLMLCYVYMIFSDIDDYIIDYFKNVHYIAPLRATAERYYRLRNLAVDEVDYQGKNLAIFIKSLSTKQIRDFNIWTMKYFGFAIQTTTNKGHISLSVKLENSNKEINLSDTGFGYSQVLPIITQLWELSSRPRKRPGYYDTEQLPIVVAIEQPELHLHPAIQAKLAKAFIASINLARENGYQLQLLLETHSETIVNYLGSAISKGAISSSDVSVILFEKKIADSNTLVKNSAFDDQGYLLDWPYGFFAPEE